MTVHVREATAADGDAVSRLLLDAFGPAEGAEIVALVDALVADPTAGPSCSLVAGEAGEVVGHILFSAARIDGGPPSLRAAILAPLAVAPAVQKRGIGGRLIGEGLSRQRADGIDLVFVLGHPSYYPRYGFHPAGVHGLAAPYPIPPENADAWMVQALRPGVLGTVNGRLRCARALDDPRYWVE